MIFLFQDFTHNYVYNDFCQLKHRAELGSTEVYLLIEVLGMPIINPYQDEFLLRDCELFMYLTIYHRAH